MRITTGCSLMRGCTLVISSDVRGDVRCHKQCVAHVLRVLRQVASGHIAGVLLAQTKMNTTLLVRCICDTFK